LKIISKGEGKLVSYRRIGLDTNVLIYYIEEHPVLLKKIEPLINRISEGKAIGITSYVTLLELLVKPLRDEDQTSLINIRQY